MVFTPVVKPIGDRHRRLIAHLAEQFQVLGIAQVFIFLLLVLKEAVHDQYDYIGWWLYEGAEDYMIWEADTSRSWCLKEPEALYDYIVEECQ